MKISIRKISFFLSATKDVSDLVKIYLSALLVSFFLLFQETIFDIDLIKLESIFICIFCLVCADTLPKVFYCVVNKINTRHFDMTKYPEGE